MSDQRTVFMETVGEGTTPKLKCRLEKADGTPEANPATLVLSLYLEDDAASDPTINSVDAVNIKNTGRGALDADGNLVVTLEPEDTALVEEDAEEEVHVALVEWTGSTGEEGWHEFQYVVVNQGRHRP